MNSKLWGLNGSDLVKGLVIAVFAPVIATLGNAMQIPGFDFATFDWGTLLSIGITAGLTYLMKNFASDDQGKFFGAIG